MPKLDDAALDAIFRTARSYNGYTDQPVTPAQLEEIWELMKMGPTSANCLPARMVWCTSDEAKDQLAACAERLVHGELHDHGREPGQCGEQLRLHGYADGACGHDG